MNINIAWKMFDEACSNNKHRELEIQQGLDGERRHAESVLGWVLKIKSKASNSLQFSAIFHDIDRVVTPGVGSGFKGDRSSREYFVHKKTHAKRSADFICELLTSEAEPKEFVNRLRFLIEHHDDEKYEIEKLNDADLDTLVTADTLSWFTTTGPNLLKAEGVIRAKKKFDFMISKLPKFAIKYLSDIKFTDERLKSFLQNKLNA